VALVYPVLLHIGPLTVYSFGVMMATGFYVAATISAREYRRRGGDPEQMWSLVVWVFFAGLVGARLLSVANAPSAFWRDPLGELLAGSGFVWYGGLIGGMSAAWWIHRRYHMRFVTVLDCTSLGLAIGQAIGRIGCHIAGDGDWGTVSNLPWAVAYDRAIVGWDYPPGVRVHPTPIYEALAYTAVFFVLLGLRKRSLPEGSLFAVYLVSSSLARFLVEFIRINPPLALGLTESQWIALALLVVGVTWIVRQRSAILQAGAGI